VSAPPVTQAPRYHPMTLQLTEAMHELHSSVRRWTAHVPQNLPYVDLMFAFGFATLGDRAQAMSLVESARKVMEVPIPKEWNVNNQYEATISAVTSNFLFKAFKYRIDQVIAGKQHMGSLAAELTSDLEETAKKARTGGKHSAHLRAGYVIDRIRGDSRIIEPNERVDVYRLCTKNQNAFQKALADLDSIREPGELATRFRTLFKDGVSGDLFPDDRLRVRILHEALPNAPRAGAAFVVELLELVPGVLATERPRNESESPEIQRKQGELLERALFLAAHYGNHDIIKKLTDSFIEHIRREPAETRIKLVNIVGRGCLRSLKRFGMRDDIDRLLTVLHNEALGGRIVDELCARHASNPDMWAAALQTLLTVAAGYLILGLHEQAEPILTTAREELLSPSATKLQPKDYTEIAQTYVAALGHGPLESGMLRLTELFREMSPRKITNTWTTSLYFSRFHLQLIEEVILAVSLHGSEPPVLPTAGLPARD
jgi:cellulose synthase operon protein C